MKVEATDLGYYGYSRRKAGEVFLLDDAKHFSKRWMKKLDQHDERPAVQRGRPRKNADEKSLVEANRAQEVSVLE